MKKHLLKISFILIISIFFLNMGENSSFAQVQTPSAPVVKSTPQQATSNSNKEVQTPLSIPEKNKYAIKQMKENGTQAKLIKFFTAMLGVLISSAVIFVGLKVYKNIALKNYSKIDTIDYEKNLESPKDFREAINLFLEKTDK